MMAPMTRAADLPEFKAPPVSEVAVSLQFNELAPFQFVTAGLLYLEFKDEFPLVEEHPPLQPAFETFGIEGGMAFPSFRFGLIPAAALPRLWFLNAKRTEIIQIQADRFVHNWRKIGDGDQYPRYEKICERFRKEIDTLQGFIKTNGLPPIVPNQVELTYVNEIPLIEPEDFRLETIFRFCQTINLTSVTGPEGVNFSVRYIISDSNSSPIGRLMVDSVPFFNAQGQRALRLMLTARGAPSKPTLDESMRFMDIARDRIVRTFTDITTDAMHRRWERLK